MGASFTLSNLTSSANSAESYRKCGGVDTDESIADLQVPLLGPGPYGSLLQACLGSLLEVATSYLESRCHPENGLRLLEPSHIV